MTGRAGVLQATPVHAPATVARPFLAEEIFECGPQIGCERPDSEFHFNPHYRSGVSMLKIYATPLSANGRKVLAVTRHLGLQAEIYDVNVYRGEGRAPQYLEINPSGKIPTLVDGEFVLSESNAILLYLAEAHGQNRLWSGDPKQRGRIAQWLFWESAHWQPTLIAFLSALVGHRLLPERIPAPEHAPDWSNALVQAVLKTLEMGLSSDAFLAGPAAGIADFAVAGMTTYFRAADFPFQRFPNIADWYARIESFESWRGTESPLWSQ